MTINVGDDSVALSGSITISSIIGTATSSGIVVVSTSNAGTVSVLGDLLLSTGTLSFGNSDALDSGCEYNLFKYVSVIRFCGLNVDLAHHHDHDDDNTIVGNKGV